MRGFRPTLNVMPSTSVTRTGRPRDAAIDVAVLAATRRQLAESGLAALSVSAVAQEAGTTRPAIYRRWPTRLELAVAAVANLAEIAPPERTDDPLADLTAELTHFRHCITDAGALALAGVMLQDGVDPELQRNYRDHLVRPRRARLRACLDRGVSAGLLAADADLAVAVSLATGSWYAYALSGASAPREWPWRVARLVWRACGGTAPTATPGASP
jgi:AcrR family transcriptional regulator